MAGEAAAESLGGGMEGSGRCCDWRALALLSRSSCPQSYSFTAEDAEDISCPSPAWRELPKEGGEDPAMAALERMELMGLKYIKGDFG